MASTVETPALASSPAATSRARPTGRRGSSAMSTVPRPAMPIVPSSVITAMAAEPSPTARWRAGRWHGQGRPWAAASPEDGQRPRAGQRQPGVGAALLPPTPPPRLAFLLLRSLRPTGDTDGDEPIRSPADRGSVDVDNQSLTGTGWN